jgi:hypothetical protein
MFDCSKPSQLSLISKSYFPCSHFSVWSVPSVVNVFRMNHGLHRYNGSYNADLVILFNVDAITAGSRLFSALPAREDVFRSDPLVSVLSVPSVVITYFSRVQDFVNPRSQPATVQRRSC